jgi:hypothetical protein
MSFRSCGWWLVCGFGGKGERRRVRRRGKSGRKEEGEGEGGEADSCECNHRCDDSVSLFLRRAGGLVLITWVTPWAMVVVGERVCSGGGGGCCAVMHVGGS